jgi:hypothetical protein
MTVVIEHGEHAVLEDELDDSEAFEAAAGRSLPSLTQPFSPQHERQFLSRANPSHSSRLNKHLSQGRVNSAPRMRQHWGTCSDMEPRLIIDATADEATYLLAEKGEVTIVTPNRTFDTDARFVPWVAASVIVATSACGHTDGGPRR